jgi:DNA polymerase I-like protein with 3'-5' exonuclease and polymerase domains
LRSLIQPEPGRALAYLDWSQQELAVAGCLSGDQAMQEAYHSGDFYLEFAKMAGNAPAYAIKATHPTVREQFKVIALGVLFGMSARGAARRLDIPLCDSRELLRCHHEVFSRFWQWSEAVEITAMLHGSLTTVFGWVCIPHPPAPRAVCAIFPCKRMEPR